MYKLLDSLLEGKEKDLSYSELEKNIGAGQGLISHQKRKNHDLSFVFVLRTVRYLQPDNELKTMKNFIEKFTKTDNLCVSMEYALSVWDFDFCRQLIKKNKELAHLNKSRKFKDWAEIYEIALHMQEKDLPLKERVHLVKEANPKHLETQILIDLLKCLIFFEKKNWIELNEMVNFLKKEVAKIKNDYIRSTFTSRLNSFMANISLYYHNDPIKARGYATLLIKDEFASQAKRHANNILGSSYMLENYEMALHFFNKYIEDLKKVGAYNLAKIIINQDIIFLKNYWGIDIENLQINDLAEKSHNYWKRGEIQKANKVFEELEKKGLSPFQKYYKGMANNNLELLFESLIDFLKLGNKFYASMPKDALGKYDIYCNLANMLYNKL